MYTVYGWDLLQWQCLWSTVADMEKILQKEETTGTEKLQVRNDVHGICTIWTASLAAITVIIITTSLQLFLGVPSNDGIDYFGGRSVGAILGEGSMTSCARGWQYVDPTNLQEELKDDTKVQMITTF